MFCQKCGTQNPDNGRFCRTCGTDLGNYAPSGPTGLQQIPSGNYYVDHKGKMRSNDPVEIWSAGLRNTLMGVGFLIIAVWLFISGAAGGRTWWWAMLFPAISFLASGISQFVRSKKLEQNRAVQAVQQPQFQQTQNPSSLPPVTPAQTDYVNPQQYSNQAPRSIYDTGGFETRPPSVTEGTTRHLQINEEGETVALPKNES